MSNTVLVHLQRSEVRGQRSEVITVNHHITTYSPLHNERDSHLQQSACVPPLACPGRLPAAPDCGAELPADQEGRLVSGARTTGPETGTAQPLADGPALVWEGCV